MVDLNKYSKKDKSKIFHSSGHAQLGYGERIGSSTNTTFNQRLKIAKKQKRAVNLYQSSRVASQAVDVPKEKQHPEVDSNIDTAGSGNFVPSRGEFNAAKVDSKIKFKEPPRRNYDPYA